MIINRDTLLRMAPILHMQIHKVSEHGVSHGLSEAGYDIRIKQTVLFKPDGWGDGRRTAAAKWINEKGRQIGSCVYGRFTLASAIEEFDMPNNLTGIVHDKSSWARQGLSVFNTVIEPGWKGFLTLELVYHGNGELIIPAGAGIAQVIFHHNTDAAAYDGRYQNQANEPVPAKAST